MNSAIKIKTSGESVDLHLPKTLVSKAYIITNDGTEDYATEASGTYKFYKVKTVGFNDAKTTLSEAVSELEKTYKEKKYTQWNASILPGMPPPTPPPTPDKAAPVITLKGDNPMTVSVGESFTDPGAVVSDNVDVARVISGNETVDRNVPGTYTLNYSASDTAGNAAVAKTRSVVVVDKEAPVITLRGSNPMTISVGESFTDPGADVSDNVDGDRFISGNGTVNTARLGTYTLNYSASDTAGNAAVVLTRSVVVSSIVSVAGGTLPSGSQLSGQTVAAFQIGVFEVTYAEWQSVCANAAASGYTD